MKMEVLCLPGCLDATQLDVEVNGQRRPGFWHLVTCLLSGLILLASVKSVEAQNLPASSATRSGIFAEGSNDSKVEFENRAVGQSNVIGQTRMRSGSAESTTTNSIEGASQYGASASNTDLFNALGEHPVSPQAKAEKTYPDFKVTGFFQLDTAFFGQNAASLATLGDINDGMGFRRARLAATGNISERASYMMEFDFAQAQARFVDVWGQVADTSLGKMRIGRFRQPFGMSDLTSIREIPFLERPTLFALGPFRQTGIMFFDTAQDKSRTYAISGFRSLSDNFGNVYGESGGYGLATRFTFLPVDQGEGRVVHLGFDYSFVDPARNIIQYASTDEVFIGQNPNLGPTSLSVLPIEFTPAFVNTGVFTVDNVNLFNVEGAIGWGRTVLQSEFRLAHVSTPVGTADLPGAYIHVRHMLTGEVDPVQLRQWGVWSSQAAKLSRSLLRQIRGMGTRRACELS